MRDKGHMHIINANVYNINKGNKQNVPHTGRNDGISREGSAYELTEGRVDVIS
jgi:hypothetical protein